MVTMRELCKRRTNMQVIESKYYRDNSSEKSATAIFILANAGDDSVAGEESLLAE